MAVVTISRQVAAMGDEVAEAAAQQLGYTFIDRKTIEKRIVELGFSAEKLKKYDEKKPGFFASLAKNRDEYLDYLQTAVLEAAAADNCVLIGRGAFVILENVKSLFSIRCISADDVRIHRLMDEFNWTEKQARSRIAESDMNRQGFHKSFFNINNEEPSHYHLVLNTGLVDVPLAATVISTVCKEIITPDLEAAGRRQIAQMLDAQKLVNKLVFEYKLNINFLHAVIHNEKLILQGVADSAALVEKAVMLAGQEMPGKKIESCISVVQDFKAYP
ncbi:MAG: cytidylate kinase-like family protein [Bacteroides sp.]|nr:cytidylate kinase-like family protein [Prevotella sp.]MCM1408786.1 cytidylate kinase-like family protein [Treponema brennaborense]MCM1470566.1 cytidylate kinase-like family protein [Bacteroides sp.]